ncbi:MAG: cytochrome c [Brevibacillus sp.]|nr:cytochrome c [Brevibacillus sp.]
MKRFSIMWMGAAIALLVSACGGQQAEPAPEQPLAEQPAETAPSGEGGEVDEAAALALYKQKCASCHGQELEGAMGPSLTDVGARHSKEEILEILKNGKGVMPGNLVSGDDADTLAAWLAAKQ